MNKVFVIILVFFSMHLYAGGTSEEVTLLSLKEIGTDEYLLVYKSSETGKTFTIEIAYDHIHYILHAKFLTKEKYLEAIELLKKQINETKLTRFGWFGSGPCLINPLTNKYRSDALEIYNEGEVRGKPEQGPLVVYAYCEYK